MLSYKKRLSELICNHLLILVIVTFYPLLVVFLLGGNFVRWSV